MKEGSRSGVLQVFEKVLLSIIGRRRRFAGRSQEEKEVSAVAEWDISKAGDQTHLNNWCGRPNLICEREAYRAVENTGPLDAGTRAGQASSAIHFGG